MSLLLPSILNPSLRSNQPFVLLQSSAVTSCLPILRKLISQNIRTNVKRHVILFSLLYPPERVANSQPQSNVDVQIFDWTDKIVGYDDDVSPDSISEEILKIVDAVPNTDPFDVIIDSADSLLDIVPSVSNVYSLLTKVLSAVRSGPNTSRLIIHIHTPSPLTPLLIQPRFCPNLIQLIAHAPVLLTHLSVSYFTPPPPLSTPSKFWQIFSPISERLYESEKLVFGNDGEGHAGDEVVVEVIIRGGAVGGEGGAGRRRGVERTIEGWSGEEGRACELRDLDSLKGVFAKKPAPEEAAPDPTQNLPFNLILTPEQERSRAQVPLPYAHEGKAQPVAQPPGAILYEPDSADDIDDDDPDEDLDI